MLGLVVDGAKQTVALEDEAAVELARLLCEAARKVCSECDECRDDWLTAGSFGHAVVAVDCHGQPRNVLHAIEGDAS